MSGLTEREILDCHSQALKEGKQCCVNLARNQDPLLIAPRGRIYGDLQRALKKLEGTCRQMSAFRGDTRWIKLGILYAKAMRTAQAAMTWQDWPKFGKLAGLFDIGMTHMTDLANRKTGRSGLILPTRPTDWLVLPDLKIPRPGLAQRLRSSVN